MDESTDRTRSLGGVILEVQRLSGRLTLAGDELMADIGLTSARWQILGVIAWLPSPRTVSAIARTLGQSRQAVQRIVNELEKGGVVHFLPNPRHKRAALIALTEKGRSLYAAAEARRVPWTEELATGLDGHDLRAAQAALAALRKLLEGQAPGGR